ncbi:NADH-quinone oxidoreductase subunit M [Peribacillus cavernae]|uniref:NADH-quinone oxidoreductase subunit M n=1 Tax=Peribacillus cavernae TaxID=1674310 RepID=A0A3S1BA31_9BACI|nr:NADH-quinone oxidoreductase subunit M [Peribacillus cavernae]MDQ0218493.1 NADH-quinone oxidoreductase subunit M [Peribacillus cavernae]RUQ31487.1 NADH-quinone oxidoreductase subunit M [Peribacillus cavernae]
MNTILLTLLVFSPLLGMLLMFLVPKTDEKNLKMLGFLSTVPALLISLYLYIQYATGTDLSRFSIKVDWFRFGNLKSYDPNLFAVDYELAVDGFSLIMVLLTSILATLAAIASMYIKKEWKGYFMLFLLLEIGMLGVFTAQNLILFFIFFEITLIPMFFLIGKWGYLEKEKAAYSFLIYNGLSSAILLIVIMILFARTGTSNIEALRHIMTVGGVSLFAPISDPMKYALLIALLAAFGIKLPIFPFHTWMLRVHVQAPPSIVMIHAGVLLKIGAFGLIRFGMGIFPEQFRDIAFIIAVLGVINLLYGAFLALIQTDFKMVLAYSSISHMGIVLIGLGALNEAGIQGAIFQVVSHGLIAALLFFLVGVMHERFGTSKINDLGGLAKILPVTSGFLLAGAMASLGLPGMSGFVSEFMAFLGLFKEEPVLAAVGALGIILTAVYLLRAVLGMTFGKTKSMSFEGISEIKGIEFAPVLVLLGLIVGIGVYPAILSEPLQATLEAIMLGIGG